MLYWSHAKDAGGGAILYRIVRIAEDINRLRGFEMRTMKGIYHIRLR